MDRDAAADAEDKEIAPLVPGSRVRPDHDVLAKRVADEIVLVHLETNRIYELNRTAAFLWDALAAGSTQAELEERLALEFDVDPEQLAREIDELLSDGPPYRRSRRHLARHVSKRGHGEVRGQRGPRLIAQHRE